MTFAGHPAIQGAFSGPLAAVLGWVTVALMSVAGAVGVYVTLLR